MLADELGIYFDEKINNRLRGVSRMDSLEIILEKSTAKYSAEEKEKFANSKNENYRKLLCNMKPEDVENAVRDTLVELKNRGYKLAIGSSSKNTQFIIQQTDLKRYFDVVADGNDIVNSKPNPEVFLVAAKRLGVEPKNCAVVEDADAGIKAAKAGNMTACALGGDAQYSENKDINLSSFADLLNYF
jgi:beta-phosphoglucomutase